MEDVLEKYAQHLKSYSESENTVYSYMRIVNKLSEYLRKTFHIDTSVADSEKIKGFMLESFYQQLECSKETKNYYVIALHKFFRWMVESGYISDDPSQILKRVKIVKNEEEFTEGDAKAYSSEQVIAIMSSIVGNKKVRIRDRAILAVLCGGGFRASEITGMTVGTFRNRRSGCLYIKRKGGAWKWVPLANFAVPYVEEYLASRGNPGDEEPLFVVKGTKNTCSRKTIWKQMAMYQKKVGVKTGVHIFRHSYLNEIERIGGVVVARDVAGQKELKTTNIYLSTSTKDRISAADRVGWSGILRKVPE